MTRTFALLGAGEFEPWSEVVDRWTTRRARPGPVLVVPTASAPEGEDVYRTWASKGLSHYRALGIPAEVLDVRTRDDARDDRVVARVLDAAAVYFSGGNPAYLAETLRDTPLWATVLDGLDGGLAYVGCSAGVACLTERTFDSARQEIDRMLGAKGLGLAKGVLFAPHWDTVDIFFPGATDFIAASTLPGETLVGIDENTALLGDGIAWEVHGQGGVHVHDADAWAHHPSGATLELPAIA